MAFEKPSGYNYKWVCTSCGRKVMSPHKPTDVSQPKCLKSLNGKHDFKCEK